jgi:hypothetical protein
MRVDHAAHLDPALDAGHRHLVAPIDAVVDPLDPGNRPGAEPVDHAAPVVRLVDGQERRLVVHPSSVSP